MALAELPSVGHSGRREGCTPVSGICGGFTEKRRLRMGILRQGTVVRGRTCKKRGTGIPASRSPEVGKKGFVYAWMRSLAGE